MNAAFITEDVSDTEVLGTFVDRIAGRAFERIHYPSTRGFGAVLATAARLSLQAARAQMHLIVVAVDCDNTKDHFEDRAPEHENCRFCQLASALPSMDMLRRAGRATPIVTALSVRTMESWLVVAAGISVPGSINDFGRTTEERKELKRLVYGTVNAPSRLLMSRGVEIAAAGDLALLEKTSRSFAAFAASVRASV